MNQKELKEKYKKRIAVTGGAGFIGSNLLLYLVPKYSDYLFVNIDCLTYAANLTNLKSIENADNYQFEKVNICDFDSLKSLFNKYKIDSVFHLAAETHVDRSIIGPSPFIQSNIVGLFNLLELGRELLDTDKSFRMLHLSTDEVFGSLVEESDEKFNELSPYRPNSPYAATKAGGDHLVRAYHKTYGLDIITVNCSNNFGPYQFPEKLIPLVINNVVKNKKIPVYGDGNQIRDWINVGDHCRALDLIFHKGEPGRCYCVGSGNEIANIDLVKMICKIIDNRMGGEPRERLITFVADRPGHDRRYAIDASRIINELGWQPKVSFVDALKCTVAWYLDNPHWLEQCIDGSYRSYYDRVYEGR